LIIPNQNLFRVANEKTTFADAFAMADQVLYSGVACITDLMVKEGLINLDFADVRAVMREMGKAMMGTGEAAGEKRALTAAEAAIANPLIDDASMKGARGLLISITGGKDLTLYEVDEAATRIRGEVDADANIIVGATFDESLEGIIRVSVVATGIDHAAIQAQRPPAAATTATPKAVTAPAAHASPTATAAENRLAELTARLRTDSRRIAERIERDAASVQTHAQMPAASAEAPAARVESAAHAAVAAALMPQQASDEDVSFQPMPMKPSLFEPAPAPAAAEAPPAKTFIPPQAERVLRQPRMPRIDELPLPAQNQLNAQRGELPDMHPEKQRMSLMQRLAAVGLGRREEPMAPPETAAQAMPPVARPRPAQDPVSEYARRGPQGLDQHGRQAPVHNAAEDDQLDIPAFLRRQAN
jgi:cell division protein FtsZ